MAKRSTASKPPAATGGSPPIWNACLIGAALCYGISLLVTRGRVSWPPHELLASTYTLCGCLALVGPIVLARRESGEGGLGELVWLAAGILVWLSDLASVARGEWRTLAWTTPLGYQPMGLAVLAVLLAGWRCGLGGKSWSWTNVVGFLLGAFWVGMGVWSIAGIGRAGSLASR